MYKRKPLQADEMVTVVSPYTRSFAKTGEKVRIVGAETTLSDGGYVRVERLGDKAQANWKAWRFIRGEPPTEPAELLKLQQYLERRG